MNISFCELAAAQIGQAVGFAVDAAADVRNREIQGSGQLAAGPVQGIKTRATALVFAGHLFHHDLGVGINVQAAGVGGERELQGFHQGDVFGDVAVLTSNPLGDADRPRFCPFNNDPNASRPRISLGSAVDVGH